MSYIGEFIEVNGINENRFFITIEELKYFSSTKCGDGKLLQIGENFIEVSQQESDRIIDILKDRFSVL